MNGNPQRLPSDRNGTRPRKGCASPRQHRLTMYYLPKQLALNAWEVSNVDLICSHASGPLTFGTEAAYLLETQLYLSCGRRAGQRSRPDVLPRTQLFRAVEDIRRFPGRISLAPNKHCLPAQSIVLALYISIMLAARLVPSVLAILATVSAGGHKQENNQPVFKQVQVLCPGLQTEDNGCTRCKPTLFRCLAKTPRHPRL
jgi:hypothetical protein